MGKIATREAYGNALRKLVEERSDIVVLDADLSKSTKSFEAKKVAPERHFNMGIAEGNMMAVAAGLAASGKTVFASTFAMFATGRAFEQIRNSVAYPNLNVKVCGSHSGITVGEDGATHQALEDIAIMRAIPNMVVLQPCDGKEAEEITRFASTYKGPMYLRFGRSAVEDVHDDSYHFELGKGEMLHQGKDIAFVATGLMVQEALKAAEMLREEGMDPTVVNMPCIKPIDETLIIELARNHRLIYTLEEHNVIGGLGSAVSEVCAKNQPVKMVMIGTQDVFGESGKPQELLDKYGLSAKRIVEKVKETIQ
ncbi:MAG: transketolase family protein [Erysipelotrichaceae bacterium]|nr:transketolase family protein [Erysipelotrichaceae bacterium]